MTRDEVLTKRMERLERAATELMYQAEQWTLTGATLYDMSVRRRALLDAGRRYGKAAAAMARQL